MRNETTKQTASKLNIQNTISNTEPYSELIEKGMAVLEKINFYKKEALKKENAFLSQAVATQRKLASKHPEFSETIPSCDKRDVEEVADFFNELLEENNRNLSKANESTH